MLTTHIRHGDIVLDMESNGSVRITRQSNAMAIELSLSEWHYVQAVASLHGWPMAPPLFDQNGQEISSGKSDQHTPG